MLIENMKHLIYIIIVCSIFISCKRTSTGTSEPQDFLLKITVKNASGETVPGLRISGGNLIANEQTFALGVFKLQMLAEHPDSGNILYRDSIYLVPTGVDINQAVLGYTSSSGTFESNDVYRFPGVLNLPSLKRTDEGANNLGTFQISGIAKLILVDTAAKLQQSYELNLKNGHNEFNLTWNPTVMSVQDVRENRAQFHSSIVGEFPISTISSNMVDTSWSGINIADNTGANRTLYMAREDLIPNPDYYELPPLPPGESFDVRFSTGHWLKTYPVSPLPDSLYRYRILMQSNHYPLTLRWNFRCPPEFHLSQSIDGQAIDARSICIKDSLTITNTDINGLIIIIPKSLNLPPDFKLYQNYPNPFSASTVIPLTLQFEAKVTLSVYTLKNDLLGKIIDRQLLYEGLSEIEYRPDFSNQILKKK